MRRQFLVLLIEPKSARNTGHAGALTRAGFRVLSLAPEEVDVVRVLAQEPAVVAAELDDAGFDTALSLTRRFRETPEARLIPFIIHGRQLGHQDIEDTARAGALWLQLEKVDGARLVAAVHGVMAASRAGPSAPAARK